MVHEPDETETYVKLTVLHPYGRVRGTVYQSGMIVDVVVGESSDAVLTTIRDMYGGVKLNAQDDLSVNYTVGDDGLWPDVDKIVNEILMETADARANGTLAPYTPGPLGLIPIDKRADLRGDNGRGGRLSPTW